MRKQQKIQEEIDLTLKSTENLKRVSQNPFLFEKTMNRLQEQNSYEENFKQIFSLKYVFIILILIILNIITLFKFRTEDATSYNKEKSIESFEEEYSISSQNYYY
jgi:hypothetical protein